MVSIIPACSKFLKKNNKKGNEEFFFVQLTIQFYKK